MFKYVAPALCASTMAVKFTAMDALASLGVPTRKPAAASLKALKKLSSNGIVRGLTCKRLADQVGEAAKIAGGKGGDLMDSLKDAVDRFDAHKLHGLFTDKIAPAVLKAAKAAGADKEAVARIGLAITDGDLDVCERGLPGIAVGYKHLGDTIEKYGPAARKAMGEETWEHFVGELAGDARALAHLAATKEGQDEGVKEDGEGGAKLAQVDDEWFAAAWGAYSAGRHFGWWNQMSDTDKLDSKDKDEFAISAAFTTAWAGYSAGHHFGFWAEGQDKAKMQDKWWYNAALAGYNTGRRNGWWSQVAEKSMDKEEWMSAAWTGYQAGRHFGWWAEDSAEEEEEFWGSVAGWGARVGFHAGQRAGWW